MSRQKSTDDKSDITFTGVISKGKSTPFSVAGEDIQLSEKTWVFGDLRIGAAAKVTASRDAGSMIIAKKVIIQ